ncbi:MFS transporter [Cedecea sp. NFIX57]|uniref:MFS transporter n=1 Tax=Cedecea sp. NFIX57 TaxID=1566286 RepID=UPI000A0B170E|nr:MFS transporter [Cedecea sp. NFIX57]SMG60880.1 drug resistance transporter, EmrB/QacA subfamily [Cedecea sp. NFIX57]
MSHSTDSPAAYQASARVSAWVMIVIGAGSVLSSLDLFVVNLAFPAIRDSFTGATNQALSWVISAYSIAFAAFLVPAGRIADIYGRKRIFKAGLAVFSVASLACAFAPDVLSLIFARGLKGVGAALMIPTSLGLLLAAYPKDRHKQMVGIWAATGSVAAALGPILGGALVNIDWRLIFLINLPVALPALWLSKHLTETEVVKSRLPDILGSLMLIAGLALLVAGISWASDWGFTSLRLWVVLGGAFAFLGLFVRRCLTQPAPALDLRVFRVPTFTLATLGMAFFYMGFAIMLLGGSLFLTQVWHWPEMKAGAAFAFGPGSAVVASVIAGRTHVSPKRLTVTAGLLFLISGVWWYGVLGDAPHYFQAYWPGMILTGIAAGIGQTGFIAGGASALPASQYATGTGIINTSRQIGAAIGVGVFVAVSGSAKAAAQFQTAWLLMAAFGLIASLSALLLRAKR